MLNKRSNFVKHVRSKIHQPFVFIHTSRIFSNGQTIEIKMPSLSPTMTEGTIVKWLKKEGDSISPGDVLCEIQTDKAVVGLEVEEEGTLSKILIPEDTKNVQLGEVIAILIEGDVDISQEKPVEKSLDNIRSVKEEKFTSSSKDKQTDSPRLFGPSVKKLLEEYGIKFSEVSVSGPHNNLLKGDVLSYIRDKNLKQVQITPKKPDLPSVPDVPTVKSTGKTLSHVDIPVSNLRRSIAQQLIQSKNTKPHVYMNIDCKIDKIFDYKKKLKLDGTEISLNEFVIKSAATALRNVPKLNMVHQDGQIKSLNSIDIAMSFVSDGNYIMTNVKNADKLTMEVISKLVNSSIEAKQTKHDDISVSSFRIHNLGAFGVSEFSEVMYPHQVATLAIGTVRSTFEEQIPSQRMKVTLSFDNAIISEIEASSFLNFFKQCLENPLNIACLS